MALPYFFESDLNDGVQEAILNEGTSKHCIQVLRMKKGSSLNITNGKGFLFSAEIIDDNKKGAAVKINNSSFFPRSEKLISIAVSPLKNNSRFEWFLEKAVETGIQEIIPLLCERSEKTNLKIQRLNNIVVAAMLQSEQTWLCNIAEPTLFNTCIENSNAKQKFIAHCMKAPKTALKDLSPFCKAQILIGPEGDFTLEEVNRAMKNNYIPVALGPSRLRTETAALTAAVLMQQL